MKSTRCAAAMAAAALLSLAACGGGGGNDAPPMTSSDPEPSLLSEFKVPVLPMPDEPSASMSSDRIKTSLNGMIDRSDTVIVEHGGRPLWHGQREVWTASPDRDVRDILVAELTGYTFAPPRHHDVFGAEAEYEFLGSAGGMSAAAAVWDEADPRGRWVYGYLSFGVWMEHSFFLARETLALDPVFDEIIVYLDIFSIGAASGTNPTALGGSATWEGIMLGFDESFAGPGIARLEDSEPNVYVGEAALTIDSFEVPVVDVRFSNITNSVRQLNDVVWTDLPVTEGGFEGRGILGRFYGPQHEEVGGVFQFDAINGAFGAVRE